MNPSAAIADPRCDKPAAGGFALRPFDVLHEYASGFLVSARGLTTRLDDFATDRHESCGLESPSAAAAEPSARESSRRAAAAES
jgi:hypothetical protein